LAVIEASFGTFDPFNRIIRATAPTAKLDASSPLGGERLRKAGEVGVADEAGEEPRRFFRRASGARTTKSATRALKGTSFTVGTGSLIQLTPTFTNGMVVTITSSDDRSNPICISESGRPSTVSPTSTTKYTLTVVSPNGIKVSDSVTIEVEAQTPASPAKPNSFMRKASSSLLRKASSSSFTRLLVFSFTRRVGKVHQAPAEAKAEVTAATDTEADSKDE
jgi:hypothetical protein